MKVFIGVLLVILGIIVGVYVGLYLMFFKGIVGIVTGIKGGWIAKDIAIGIIKIIFASFTGWVSFALLAIPGIAMLKN